MRIIRNTPPWLFAALVAVFFMCAQAGSIAHAASHGSAPHSHDGKICVLSILVNEDDDQDDRAMPPVDIRLAQPVSLQLGQPETADICAQNHTINTTARSPPAG